MVANFPPVIIMLACWILAYIVFKIGCFIEDHQGNPKIVHIFSELCMTLIAISITLLILVGLDGLF